MLALLYIHGFLSSPQSSKAQQLQGWLSREGGRYDEGLHFHCPALSAYPDKAVAALDELVANLKGDYEQVGLVGSSLGGFWSTWLAEKYDLRAVLINPGVRPHQRFASFLGQVLKNFYSEDAYVLRSDHLDVLERIDVPSLAKPERFWLLAQTGDEVLDYRDAVEKYAGARQSVIEGGNHSFANFEAFIPDIINFLFYSQTESGPSSAAGTSL